MAGLDKKYQKINTFYIQMDWRELDGDKLWGFHPLVSTPQRTGPLLQGFTRFTKDFHIFQSPIHPWICPLTSLSHFAPAGKPCTTHWRLPPANILPAASAPRWRAPCAPPALPGSHPSPDPPAAPPHAAAVPIPAPPWLRRCGGAVLRWPGRWRVWKHRRGRYHLRIEGTEGTNPTPGVFLRKLNEISISFKYGTVAKKNWMFLNLPQKINAAPKRVSGREKHQWLSNYLVSRIELS